MGENRIYYWLKLDENFFEDDTISWIEEQENGKDYVIFYLKLCLKSLTNDGYLVRYVGQKLIPYDVKALSNITNTPLDTVAVAMKTFIEIGLITQLDSGELYLNQINEMIGSETSAAKRMRKSRARRKLLQNSTGDRNNVTNGRNNVQKCYTEKEKEKEIEKEIEIDKEKEKEVSSANAQDRLPFKEIIDYLNQKTNSSYRYTTGKTKELIRARYNEGFGLEDFKKVIDIKTAEWLNDNKMKQYLRPTTLFGNKFESYLNQKQQNDMQWLDDLM